MRDLIRRLAYYGPVYRLLIRTGMPIWIEPDGSRCCDRLHVGQVEPGMVILNPGMQEANTPRCCSTAWFVMHIDPPPALADGRVVVRTQCGHSCRVNWYMHVDVYTPEMADLFGTLVMEEAERLGLGHK